MAGCGCKKCVGSVSSKGSKGNNGSDGDDGSDGLFGGYSSNWLFDTGTANNPSLRTVRLNNASAALTTAIYVNTTNFLSIDIAAFLASFSNGGYFGWIRLFDELDSTVFHYYKITAVATVGAVTTLTVTYVDGDGAFTNTNKLVLSFVPKGEDGAAGNNGTDSYKFSKEFTTDEIEQDLTISRAEYEECGVNPAGCKDSAFDQNGFDNCHIQVWLYVEDAAGDYWKLLMCGGLSSGTDYSLKVSTAAGLITISTGNNQGLYRAVILG